MTKTDFESKTEHILYIVTNARYHSGYNDGQEFDKSLDLFAKLPTLSPLGLLGETYQQDYAFGMYPELEDAVKYFGQKVSPSLNKGLLLTDDVLHGFAEETIKKFGLKKGYNFSREPNPEQLTRLNHRIFPKLIRDMRELAPEFLMEMGIALSRTVNDFRLVYKFMDCFSYIGRILSGEISKKDAQQFLSLKGVPLGLSMLELVENGIIDKDLHILDPKRLCQSKQVKEFEFDGKKYNLSPALQGHYSESKKTPKTSGGFLNLISKKIKRLTGSTKETRTP